MLLLIDDMKVLIIKREKIKNTDLKKLLISLDKKNVKYELVEYNRVDEFYDDIHKKDFVNTYNILISLGGDGTILKSARVARKLNIPILGINVGTLGFLTSIKELKNVNTYIDLLIKKKYNLEERSMLSVEVFRDNDNIFLSYAVNEATITTQNLRKIGKYNVSIGSIENVFNEYRADGLIIASPTGSTAHSLSAGGPIVAPDVNCFIISAICPHAFNQRSIVVNGDSDIYVSILNEEQIVDIDGRVTCDLMQDDVVKISKLKRTVKYIVFNDNNFLNNIKNKIKSI